MELSPQDRIILALDVPNAHTACHWIDRLPDVRFWKVGLELFIADGPIVLRYLRDRGKKIFLDLKLHDIPHTVARACRATLQYQVDFVTVHASGGNAMLQAAQEALSGTSTQLLAVTLLTSFSPQELTSVLQVSVPLQAYVEHLARIAQEHQLAGVVCSPQEVQELRAMVDPHFLLVTPGIRLAGDSPGDQHRTTTPQAAIGAGATYIVIGRSVLQATNPIHAWEQALAQLA